ncbi:hypothetical protein EJM73_09230 [Clostridium botulinum]|uniref:hypothetical protein n=1 Tax=Clostridium botulinum TaxID=1491 RepID=UPI001375FA69|nr:hypothetical protein [Clostridium botulinum]NCI19808.1 hypothetical protein [Clostridium botulinum]NCI35846.1 hypothetical protein [Clostridium botulinum]NCI71703.1 hypothetical protein [Clostridium botulinum]NDI38895.1 hypothetical protein [Clostridium botulinum]
MKNIKTLLNKMFELGCDISCNMDGYICYYGNGCFTTSSIEEYESDKELNNLCIIECDNTTNNIVIHEENIKYIEREKEIAELKMKAHQIEKINTDLKNTKIEKMLVLALNKACSFGELRNSIVLAINILKTKGIAI